MIIQISSGQGPAECEYAVGRFIPLFLAEVDGAKILKKVPGHARECYQSVLLSIPEGAAYPGGTIKWISASPFRPKHKRKNWFIEICPFEEPKQDNFSQDLVRFETFRSGGKGGQNVNKVETGVRAIHVPTGIAVTSTTARTQLLNRKLALSRLSDIIAQQNNAASSLLAETMRLQHEMVVRGNPVRIYEGMEFVRVR